MLVDAWPEMGQICGGDSIFLSGGSDQTDRSGFASGSICHRLGKPKCPQQNPDAVVVTVAGDQRRLYFDLLAASVFGSLRVIFSYRPA
jgi:hypothetical protein